jgi:hypothetical protein
MPRLAPSRGQALLGLFMAALLAGALLASATVVFACAGLSSCHNGQVASSAESLALPGYGPRG